jgi:hypothetical protein
MEGLKKWLRIPKRYGAILMFIVVAQLIFPDAGQLAVVIFSLSVVAMVLMAADTMLDDRAGWGFFPYIDMSELVKKASSDPVGSAIVFAAVVYLLTTIIQVAAGR